MAIKWMAGFETGDLSELATVTGGSIDSTTVRSGAYSLRNTSGTCNSPVGLGLSQAFVGFGLYVPSGYSAFSARSVLLLSTTTTTIVAVQIDTSGGSIQLSLYINGSLGITGSPFTASPDTWYWVELKYDSSNACELRVNGTSIQTGTKSASATVDFVAIGTGVALPVNFDDIVIDDTAYVGAARIVARQGTSGTPTYNAFTKSNSSTIDTVWSDTPVSATTNASSNGSAAAQTMLIASFASTQTGHGTDVIASGDTIVAAKNCFVGKRGTGGSLSVSHRRRLASVDTDDLIGTLTTAVVFYSSSLWTATFTNLNSMEAGVVRASGTSQTTTVEDLWVMVAYVPAGVSGLSVTAADKFGTTVSGDNWNDAQAHTLSGTVLTLAPTDSGSSNWSDALSKAIVGLVLSDTIQFNDSVALGYGSRIVDVVTLTDAVSVVLSTSVITVAVSDQLVLTDTINVALVGLVIADTIVLQDFLSLGFGLLPEDLETANWNDAQAQTLSGGILELTLTLTDNAGGSWLDSFATLKVVRVKPGGTVGVDCEYTSLQAAVTGEAANLVTLSRRLDIVCYAGNAADTRAVVSGFTTDSTHYIRIYTPSTERHVGKWDDTKYRIVDHVGPSGNDYGQLHLNANYTQVEGLQVYLDSVTVNSIHAVRLAAANCSISDCIIRSASDGSHSYIDGLLVYQAGAGYLKFWNNIVYDFPGFSTTNDGILQYDPTIDIYAYNNTFHNCGAALARVTSGGSATLKNNIASSCGTAFVGGFAISTSSDYNATSGSAFGSNYTPNTNDRVSQTFDFVGVVSRDLHLSQLDTGAKGFGDDLSTDPVIPITDDVDGQLRAVPWDIGADKWSILVARVSDTVTMSDAVVTFLGTGGGSELTETPSDSFTFIDDVNLGQGYGFADSNQTNSFDALQVGLGLVVNDSNAGNWLDITPTLLGIQSLVSVDQFNNWLDNFAYVSTLLLVLSDSITLSDAVRSTIGLLVVDSETANWNDNVNVNVGNALITKVLSDSFTLADTLALSFGDAVSDSNQVNNLDAVAIGRGIGIIGEQNLQVDGLGLGRGYVLVDTANNWLDAVSVAITTLIVSDTMVLADSLRLGYGDLVVDQLSLSDAFSFAYAGVTVVDSFVLLDSLKLGYGLTIVDNEVMSDTDGVIENYLVSVNTETLVMTDSVSVAVTAMSLADALTLTDGFALGYGDIVADQFALVDAFNVAVVGLAFADSFTLTDSVDKTIAGLLLVDTLVMSELVALGYGNATSDSESANWNDNVQINTGAALLSLVLADSNATSWSDISSIGFGFSWVDSVSWLDAIQVGYSLQVVEAQVAYLDVLALGRGIAASDTGTGNWLDVASVAITSLSLFDTNVANWTDGISLAFNGVVVVGVFPAFTDSWSGLLAHYLVVGDDANNWLDIVQVNAGQALQSLSLVDALSMSDVLAYGLGLQISDNANNWLDFVPTVVGQMAFAIGDSYLNAWQDGVVYIAELPLVLLDSNALSDVVNAGYGNVIADVLTFGDVVGIGYGLATAEQMTLADNVNVSMGSTVLQVPVQDTLVLSDSITLAFSYGIRFVSETLSLSDTAAIGRGNVLSDTLVFTEQLQLGHGQALTEAIAFADASQLQLNTFLVVSDTLLMLDSVVLSASSTIINVGISDQLTMVDTLAALETYRLTAVDTNVMLDALVPVKSFNVQLGDQADAYFDVLGSILEVRMILNDNAYGWQEFSQLLYHVNLAVQDVDLDWLDDLGRALQHLLIVVDNNSVYVDQLVMSLLSGLGVVLSDYAGSAWLEDLITRVINGIGPVTVRSVNITPLVQVAGINIMPQVRVSGVEVSARVILNSQHAITIEPQVRVRDVDIELDVSVQGVGG